ncbi:MAG: ABC transporter ATP-binding protein [Oscillospiraceae bacterium]
MIEFHGVSKIYKGDKKAVDKLNLIVKKGDLFAFIGHNGAGKTTTIKALMGIISFEEGEILIDGISVKKNSDKTKEIMAYIPDNPDLYENIKGIDYLNFICDIYKVNKEKREIKIKEYADLFDITKNLGDKISTYSHGMKQKLALISAFVHDPKILVLDEPFVGLDPKASIILKELMKSLCDKGNCIFFSTHVLDVAEKFCNKVGIIKGGKLIKSGSMDEIIGKKSLEQVFMELSE